MSEAAYFCLGIVFGALLSGALLLLYGQHLFASGRVFAPELEELTDDEAVMVAEERLRDLTERAKHIARLRPLSEGWWSAFERDHAEARAADRARRAR
jgi:hypothetical protein